MTTKELLETYYAGLAKKDDWDSVLSDDFKFVGGDITKTDPLTGREEYNETIRRFSRVFTGMRVKEMICNGDSASVIANYDYAFPNGEKINGNVAEFWKVKDGKLDALTIFFDTLGFNKFKGN